MPKKFKDCVAKVQASGKSKDSSYAICTASNAGGIKQVRKTEARRNRAKGEFKK